MNVQNGPGGLSRIELEGAVETKLFFAQVREDPLIEIAALAPKESDRVVVVSSGGCTALSLLAAGAGRVDAVDLNKAQNHLVELKVAALTSLDAGDCLSFLGGAPADAGWRKDVYDRLEAQLSPAARAYWRSHRKAVVNGVLGQGVSEKFVKAVVAVMKVAVHPPSRIRKLLALESVEDQRRFYDEEWNTRRWRALFAVLLNRAVFRKAYDPAFFRYVKNPSFSKHFLGLMKHVLTELPLRDNYFMHHMLTGRYPSDNEQGLPPYLQVNGVRTVAERAGSITLIDGTYVDHLRQCDDGSVDAFALSNIAEWLDETQFDDLMSEVVRTAAPGARLVFRNFVGWNEVPQRWAEVIVEDRERGESLIAGDRSGLQYRVAVCSVKK